MWRVQFVYFHPYIEFEDVCYLDFDTDLDAWRAHELLFKCNNVLTVYKPVKIL